MNGIGQMGQNQFYNQMNGFPQMGINQLYNQQQMFGQNGHGIQNPMANQMQNVQTQNPTKDPDEVYQIQKRPTAPLASGAWPTDCNHLYNLGAKQNGVYIVKPNQTSEKTYKVR